MTTPELLTKEEKRVWLATYEAGLRAGQTIPHAAEVADLTVERSWRARVAAKVDASENLETIQRLVKERDAFRRATHQADVLSEAAVRAVEEGRAKLKESTEETDLLRAQRDAARTLLDDVRIALKTPSVADEGLPAVITGFMAANDALRGEMDAILGALPPGSGTVVERVRELVKSIAVWRETGDIFEDKRRLIAERDRLQQDISAMKERIRSLEASSSACHQDLAAVRVALGSHNSPERSVAECMGRLMFEVQTLRQARQDAKMALGEYRQHDESVVAGIEALRGRVGALREMLLETVTGHHDSALMAGDGQYSSHTEPWPMCQNTTCRQGREVLGEDWLRARGAAEAAEIDDE